MVSPSDTEDFADQAVWTAGQARVLANYIAMSPYLFQGIATMRDSGLLLAAYRAGRRGMTIEEGVAASGLSAYGVEILRDLGGCVGLFKVDDGGRFRPTTLTHFLLFDESTNVQFALSQHFSWEGLPRLQEALETRTPAGLKTYGDWDSVYEHLAELPSPAREAWFAYDHHYSDSAFDAALPHVVERVKGTLLDIGGNTGRFANKLFEADPDIRIVIQDFPGQLGVADAELARQGWAGRYGLHTCDALDPAQPFYDRADAAWMSQFLSCFSLPQITSLFRRSAEALPKGAPIFVLDCFHDRQSRPSSDYSLHALSLYFACFANGDGKIHSASTVLQCAADAGLEVLDEVDGIGVAHTLFVFAMMG